MNNVPFNENEIVLRLLVFKGTISLLLSHLQKAT